MSKKKSKLDVHERSIMLILDNHKGSDSAISSTGLVEKINVDGWPEKIESRKRKMREIITHLIIEHNIPIASIAGDDGGYFLAKDKKDIQKFRHSFHRRAMTGLIKISRIMKCAPLEGAVQLTIESVTDGKKIPGIGKALEKLLRMFQQDPKLYSEEIEKLKPELEKLQFVPQKRIEEINAAAKHLEQLTGRMLNAS